jgi:hypothetical protein
MFQTSVVVPSALVLPPLPDDPPHAAIPSTRLAAAAPARARLQILLILMWLLDAETGTEIGCLCQTRVCGATGQGSETVFQGFPGARRNKDILCPEQARKVLTG